MFGANHPAVENGLVYFAKHEGQAQDLRGNKNAKTG